MTLRDFINDEMRRRQMSQRQFADFVGVSHQTISRALDLHAPPEPSLDFLYKLAKSTGTDCCTLFLLIYPDLSSLSPRARLLAQQIDSLPAELQDILERYLLGVALLDTRPTG